MLGAASSEDAATEDEVRSMLDPELTAALEHLDSTCIQAMLEDEGEVPPLQSANAANAASPAHTPADAASASEQTPLTKLLGSSLLAWRGTLRTLGYDDVTDYSNIDEASRAEHRLPPGWKFGTTRTARNHPPLHLYNHSIH